MVKHLKKLAALAVVLALMVGAVPGWAQEAATPEPTSSVLGFLDQAAQSAESWVKETGEIEVHGQAVRTVMPDTVSINVGATLEDKSEKVAQEKANAVMNDVVAAMKALGIAENQITTSGYNITRKSDSGLLSTAGYIARVSLRVTVKDFDLINAVLDAAVEKGANEVNGISFSYSDEGAVYQEALRDAIAAAMDKAQVMADAAGVELRTLLALRETSSGSAYRNTYAAAEAKSTSGGGGTKIMSGEIEISANVTMVYKTK